MPSQQGTFMSRPQNKHEMFAGIDSQLKLNAESIKTFCMEICGGDTDTIAELVQMYLVSLDELTGQISASLASGDLPLLRRASHTLKSSTRVFGGEALAHTCEQMEQAALSADLSQAPALLMKIQSQREVMHQQLIVEIDFMLSTL
jgi:HPt (histidine-containing phosphotransfer) domain-containing protein